MEQKPEIPPISEEAARAASDNLRDSTSKIAKAADLDANAKMRSAEASRQLEQGLSQLSSGTIQFTKALVDGTDGLNKYSQSVDNVASGLGNMLMSLGPLPAILGLAVKAFGKLASNTLAEDQMIIDGYDKLANLGGSIDFTTDKLRDMGRAAGYSVTSRTFPKFVDIVAGVGKDLVMLGSTAGDGMMRFGEISKLSNEERDKFNTLGITQEKLTKVQGMYIQDQARLGLMRKRDTDELKKSSLAYATNLIALSALTGESVDDLAKKRADQMNNLAFNLEMREMSATEEGKAKADKIRDFVTRISSDFGDKFEQGSMTILGGAENTSESAIAMSRLTGGAINDLLRDYKKNPTAEKEIAILNLFKNSVNEQTKGVGKAFKANTDIANDFAISGKALEGASKDYSIATEDEAKAADAAKKRQDAIKEAQSKANDLTRDLGTAFDRLAEMISGPVNQGFRALLTGFKMLTKGFLKIADKLGMTDDPALPYLFDSIEDLSAQYKETQKQAADARADFAKKYKEGDVEKSKKTSWSRDIPFSEDTSAAAAQAGIKSLEKQQAAIAEALKRQAGDNWKDKLQQQEPVKTEEKKTEEPKKPEPVKQPEGKKPEQPQPVKTEEKKTEEPKKPDVVKTEKKEEVKPVEKVKVEPPKETKKVEEPKKPEVRKEEPKKPEQPVKQEKVKQPELDKSGRATAQTDPRVLANQPKTENKNADATSKLTQTVINVPKDKSKITVENPNLPKKDDKDVSKQQTPPGHRNGGIAKGPQTGYGDIFHGLEAGVPLPDGKSIPVSIKLPTDLTTKRDSMLSNPNQLDSIMSQYMTTLKESLDNLTTPPEVAQPARDNSRELLVLITDKMDYMLDKLKDNNHIQQEMLQRSKV